MFFISSRPLYAEDGDAAGRSLRPLFSADVRKFPFFAVIPQAMYLRGHTARVFSLLHSSRVLFCGIPQQPVPFLSVLSLATCGHTAIDAAVAKRPQFPCGRNRNFAAAPCRKLFCDGHSACMCGHPQVAQSTFCAVNRKLLLFLVHAVHGMRGSMCCFLFRSLFVGCVLLRSLFVCLLVQQHLFLLRDVEASRR